MSASGRSRLFRQELPPQLDALLKREGVKASAAWLVTATDLNLSGNYESIHLIVEKERLITAALPGPEFSCATHMILNRGSITDIRARQGIGGGFLEAQVDGVYVEVLAYSNAHADDFHKVTGKLKRWVKGDPVEVTPEDDVNPRKCQTCGMTLEFKGETCRRCVNRGAVLSRVMRIMKPYAGWAALMLAVLLVITGLQMIPPRLTKVLVDRVLAPEQAGNTVLTEAQRLHLLWYLVLGLCGVLVLTTLGNIINGRINSYVGTRITFDVRNRLFQRFTQLSVDYYDRHSVGNLVSRMGNDTDALRGFIRQATQGFLAQILMLIVTGAMLFSLSWKLALWTLLPAPLVVTASIFYWRRLYPRYFKVWEAWSRMMGSFGSILSGIRVVKSFGQEQRENDRFAHSTEYLRDAGRRVEYATSIFNPLMGLIFSMGGLIVWLVGGRDVVGSDLTLGDLMAFFAYLPLFYAPLTNLTQLTDWFTQFLTAAQRTFEILDTPPQIADKPGAVALTNPLGEVTMEGVSFGYNRHEPVLKNISFRIKPGERIGIVGKSGSGKTTITNLLGRLYDVDEGRVLLDGQDVRDLRTSDVHRCVGIVLQDPFLFRGTIYENLVYGHHDATPEQVLAAAKAANAHDFIIRHPLGYDTYIGERGAGLSGGERQRISIARALLYDPRVLILDEATSSVDTESEQLIQEALMRVTAGRTTIAIAHRLSTLKNSDRILVMEDGRIVEEGPHEQLMALNGLYYRLVKIQTELTREPSVDAVVAAQKSKK